MNNKPWGAWLGSLFSFIIFLFSQIIGFLIIFFLGAYFDYFSEHFGFALTIGAIISAIVSIFLVLIFIILSKFPIKEYLSLKNFSFKSFSLWFLIFGTFISTSEYLLQYFEISKIPDFLIKAYNTTEYPILLFIAIIFCYPIYEEILFRGFLFKSLERSKLGGIGAVLITSFFWSILHIQYNLLVMFVIFIAGIIFGMSRLKTNSLYIPITLHILQNLASSIFFYFSLK